MDRNLAIVLFALIFFSGAFGFLTYAWRISDRPQSKFALRLCIIFWFAGLFTLAMVLWSGTAD